MRKREAMPHREGKAECALEPSAATTMAVRPIVILRAEAPAWAAGPRTPVAAADSTVVGAAVVTAVAVGADRQGSAALRIELVPARRMFELEKSKV